MARRFRTVTRGNRQVRESLWLGIATTITNLSAANTAFRMNALNAAALALRPFTVVRTRGFLGVRTDQLSSDESYDVSMGHAVVSSQAIAVGITALPTPQTDLGSDLFYVFETIMGRFQFGDATGSPPNSLVGMSYDSKAMRRVNDDQDIAFVIENSSVSSGCTVHHVCRTLIKLH